jgi:hypothetical protein
MGYLLVLALLTGCAPMHTMTLYPRGGGTPAAGVLSTSEWTMNVDLDGERYAGRYFGAQSSSIGIGTSGGARPQIGTAGGVSRSNQYAGLLTSQSGKTIRCEFMGEKRTGGNGVCQSGDGRVFDLQLVPQ